MKEITLNEYFEENTVFPRGGFVKMVGAGGGEIYILANNNYNEFTLICLRDGNRWLNPIKFNGESIYSLSREQMIKVLGGEQLLCSQIASSPFLELEKKKRWVKQRSGAGANSEKL